MTYVSPACESEIRRRVDALTHGKIYTDHVHLSPGLLCPKRTLLKVLGCDVSQDPEPVDPLAREARRAYRKLGEEDDGA